MCSSCGCWGGRLRNRLVRSWKVESDSHHPDSECLSFHSVLGNFVHLRSYTDLMCRFEMFRCKFRTTFKSRGVPYTGDRKYPKSIVTSNIAHPTTTCFHTSNTTTITKVSPKAAVPQHLPLIRISPAGPEPPSIVDSPSVPTAAITTEATKNICTIHHVSSSSSSSHPA